MSHSPAAAAGAWLLLAEQADRGAVPQRRLTARIKQKCIADLQRG
jgi:hypothetical protein